MGAVPQGNRAAASRNRRLTIQRASLEDGARTGALPKRFAFCRERAADLAAVRLIVDSVLQFPDLERGQEEALGSG